ncbi:MAG: hypothetical protein R3Y60_03975 [bacterium]
MIREIGVTLCRVVVLTLIVVLTILLIVEVSKETVYVYEVLDSPNITLYDNSGNEINEINDIILSSNESPVYKLKLENYNEEGLEYRIVFDVFTEYDILQYLEITFDDKSIPFSGYRGASNWMSTDCSVITYDLIFSLKSTSNIYQSTEILFDFRIESNK